MNSLNIFIIIILSVLTLVGTWLYIRFARKHSIIDIPNERSSHTHPTPRGGGIIFVTCIYAGFLLFYLNGSMDRSLFLSLLPGLGLALSGLVDDRRGLGPPVKLVIQVLCAGVAILILFEPIQNEPEIRSIWLPAFSLVALVWFINLFNFLDGSDGYASMEAICILGVSWWISGAQVILLPLFCVLAFLLWNWPKAKVFMGDSGSTTLGFVLLVFGIWAHLKLEADILIWIIVSALFWFDATLTLFRRLIGREPITAAHKKHMYQRLIQGGFSHRKVLLGGFIINLVLVLVAALYYYQLVSRVVSILLTLFLMTLAGLYTEKRFRFSKTQQDVRNDP